MPIPLITRNLTDGNLERPTGQETFNRRVVLIGTAEDGPMYEPVQVRGVADAQSVFGRFGQGSLVRAIRECLDAQSSSEGTPQVLGVRMGGLIAEEASLTLQDSGSNDVLTLQALYAGAAYNNIAFQLTSLNEVKIYNPKTDLWSVFTYDADSDNTVVDVHSTAELADAINADTNLNTILVAESIPDTFSYEARLNNTDAAVVSTASGETVISIGDLVVADDIQATKLLDGAASDAPTTAQLDNQISAVSKVYSITESGVVELETDGKSSIVLDKLPLDGKSSSIFNTLLGIEDVRHSTGTFLEMAITGSGNTVTSEAYFRHRNELITSDLDVPDAATSLALTITAPWGMAWQSDVATDFFAAGSYPTGVDATDIQEPDGSLYNTASIGTATFTGSGLDDLTEGGTFTGTDNTTYTVEIDGENTPDTFRWSKNGGATWVAETVAVTGSAQTLDNGVTVTFGATTGHTSGEYWTFTATANNVYKLEWRASGAAANDWNQIKIPTTSETSFAWAASEVTLTLNNDDGKLDELRTAAQGGSLRVSFDSNIQVMNEQTTLTNLTTAGGYDDYFIRGKELVLGAVAPANLVVRYAAVNYYDLGSTLSVVEGADGPLLSFVGEDIQPGPAGSAIGSTDTIIGFVYETSPEWISLAATTALSGGTNGISLSNNDKYDELVEAYNRIDGTAFDILAVPGAYFDSTKTGYNSVTGLPQVTNAGYQTLMSDFLESYNGEAVGIIGFEPITGTGTNQTITRTDVSNRVEKLTEVDLDSDPLRAANFLNSFNQKFMVAIDAEPIFSAGGTLYTGTIEAAAAGHLSTLAPNESFYIAPVKGTVGLRYSYLSKDSNGVRQLNALADARIIAANINNTGNVQLVDAPTLAAAGSDYERLTTLWIVRRVVEVARRVGGDYLGRAATSERLTAFETRLRSEIGVLVPNHLTTFSLQIKSTPRQRVLGQIDVSLYLVPVFEIRSIGITVVLRSEETALAEAGA